MNEEMQIKIIELMDDGATLESSSELRELVNSSEEAKSFYESILVSESAIKGFFGGDKAKELSNKIRKALPTEPQSFDYLPSWTK